MSSRQQSDTAVEVGILADPEATAQRVSRRLDEELPPLLARRFSDGPDWRVQVGLEDLPVGDIRDHSAIMEFGRRRRHEEGWDVAVLLTDQPLRDGRKALVADLAPVEQLAVVSLPAFGAARLRQQVTRLVVELVVELMGARDGQADRRKGDPYLAGRTLPGRLRLAPHNDGAGGLRVVAPLGRWRLLIGMVWDNRPWRLVAGMRGAMVGALAFSLFWLLSPVIWRLGAALNAWRLALISVATITAMVVWLILYHGLWERSHRDTEWRDEATLFNASTVASLLIGVACAYLVLLLINFLVAVGMITSSVLGDELERTASLRDYSSLTWLSTSCATFAGALGSGLDSKAAVREAAYSRRAQERRDMFRQRSSNYSG